MDSISNARIQDVENIARLIGENMKNRDVDAYKAQKQSEYDQEVVKRDLDNGAQQTKINEIVAQHTNDKLLVTRLNAQHDSYNAHNANLVKINQEYEKKISDLKKGAVDHKSILTGNLDAINLAGLNSHLQVTLSAQGIRTHGDVLSQGNRGRVFGVFSAIISG